MTRSFLPLLLAVPLALAACGDADSDERADMPGMGAEATDEMHEMPDGTLSTGGGAVKTLEQLPAKAGTGCHLR